MLSVNGFRAALRYLTMFKEGMICTVSLSFLTVVFGFLLALVLALMRMSRVKPLSIFASIYVEVFRATPMLVQLFIIYYIVFGGVSLPSFKLFGFIRFERFLPGVISLALNSAAYLSEIIRAGIQSIDPGQSEAARSLGLTRRQTLQSIVLPQAIKNIRDDHQGVVHLLYHRRAGDHVRRELREVRDVLHWRAADHRCLRVFLPDVPDVEDHPVFRKENEPWRPEIS